MNTPLILFYKKLPLGVINHIQRYIVNEIPKKALEHFFYIIIQKQQLYDQFVYYNYILKNCYCFSIEYNCNIQTGHIIAVFVLLCKKNVLMLFLVFH
jgi:hypothetical protein